MFLCAYPALFLSLLENMKVQECNKTRAYDFLGHLQQLVMGVTRGKAREVELAFDHAVRLCRSNGAVQKTADEVRTLQLVLATVQEHRCRTQKGRDFFASFQMPVNPDVVEALKANLSSALQLSSEQLQSCAVKGVSKLGELLQKPKARKSKAEMTDGIFGPFLALKEQLKATEQIVPALEHELNAHEEQWMDLVQKHFGELCKVDDSGVVKRIVRDWLDWLTPMVGEETRVTKQAIRMHYEHCLTALFPGAADPIPGIRRTLETTCRMISAADWQKHQKAVEMETVESLQQIDRKQAESLRTMIDRSLEKYRVQLLKMLQYRGFAKLLACLSDDSNEDTAFQQEILEWLQSKQQAFSSIANLYSSGSPSGQEVGQLGKQMCSSAPNRLLFKQLVLDKEMKEMMDETLTVQHMCAPKRGSPLAQQFAAHEPALTFFTAQRTTLKREFPEPDPAAIPQLNEALDKNGLKMFEVESDSHSLFRSLAMARLRRKDDVPDLGDLHKLMHKFMRKLVRPLTPPAPLDSAIPAFVAHRCVAV